MLSRPRVSTLIIVLGVVTRSVPAHAQPRSAQDLLNEGVIEYDNERFDAARALFLQARALAGDMAQPHRWLGMALARLGRCADAEASFHVFHNIAVKKGLDPLIVELKGVVAECRRMVAALPLPPPSPTMPPAVTPPRSASPSPAPPTAPALPPSDTRRSLNLAGISTIAAGLILGLGIGGGLQLAASAQAEIMLIRDVPFDPAVEERGLLYQNLSFAALGVGAALVVAGAVMLDIDRRRAAAARRGVSSLRWTPFVGQRRIGALLQLEF